MESINVTLIFHDIVQLTFTIQLSILIDCSSNLNYILHLYYVQLQFMSPTFILLIKYNSKDDLNIVHFLHIKIDTCI